ncbi:DUF6192 family protein [Sphaerisporangium sp. NPDC051011]|uniref:DUF6192 family protein n=1 Tax=Sphaerisporangium sp. NPDC051011 TaxID=3155792 RepID=UPI003400E68B
MTASLVTEYGPEKWDDQVRRGREFVGGETLSQFGVGDVALEIVPLPPPGKRLPAKAYKLLGLYAEEVGLELPRLEEYRLVSGSWPKERRNEHASWTVHRILSYQPDRFNMINDPPVYQRTGERRWTCDAANRALGWKPDTPETAEEAIRHVEDLIKDDRVAVEVLDRVMQRPEVVRRAVDRPHVRETFNRAQTSSIRHAHDETKKRPDVRRVNEQQEVLTVLGLCSAFASGVGRTLPGLHLAELSDDSKISIREGINRVRAAVDWIEHVLDTGRLDFDKDLIRLLEGGS